MGVNPRWCEIRGPALSGRPCGAGRRVGAGRRKSKAAP